MLANCTIISTQINNWKDFVFLIRKINKNDSLIAFLENESIKGKKVKNYEELRKVKHISDMKNRKTKMEYIDLKNLGWLSKYITELNTEKKLEIESKRMKHCVRGYWKYVRNCSQRIFHIKINNFESTLSLDYKTGIIRQHVSVKNQKANSINQNLATILSRNYKFFIS